MKILRLFEKKTPHCYKVTVYHTAEYSENYGWFNRKPDIYYFDTAFHPIQIRKAIMSNSDKVANLVFEIIDERKKKK